MSQSHRTARLLTCLALVIAFTLGAGPPASAAECPNADVAPTADNLGDVRGAILCMTNVERRSRDLRPLRENQRLRKAAGSHSADMVRNRFFAHTGHDGDSFVDRVIDAGYVTRNDGWKLGENLAWGTGDLSTARAVHDAWMKSPGHKPTSSGRPTASSASASGSASPTTTASARRSPTTSGSRREDRRRSPRAAHPHLRPQSGCRQAALAAGHRVRPGADRDGDRRWLRPDRDRQRGAVADHRAPATELAGGRSQDLVLAPDDAIGRAMTRQRLISGERRLLRGVGAAAPGRRQPGLGRAHRVARRRREPGHADLPAPGHLRAARARGAPALPGRPRPADGPVQPPPLRAGARAPGPAPPPDRRGRSGADDRPRRLQGASTTSSATPSATSCCAALGASLQRAQPRDRRARPAQRRRVRRPAARSGSRRRRRSSPRSSSSWCARHASGVRAANGRR